jgi:putative sigma-54 modulation protein
MNVNLTSTNFKLDIATREIVNQKFKKIKDRLPAGTQCDIILSRETNPRIKNNQKAEANLRIKGGNINASASENNIITAVGKVLDELTRQLNVRKDRRKSNQRAGAKTIRHR